MNLKFDRIAAIVFFVVGVIFVVQAQSISGSAYGSNVGPKVFPTGLGILLIFLSIILLIETIKYKATYKIVGESEDLSTPQYKRFLIILIAALAYIFLLEKIGYVISTFAFLLIGFQTLEKGKWISSTLVAAGFSVFIYVFFVNVLGGSLPGLPF